MRASFLSLLAIASQWPSLARAFTTSTSSSTSYNQRVVRTTTTTAVAAVPHPQHHPHHLAVRTTLAGKLWPTLKRLRIGRETARGIVREVVANTHYMDVIVLLAVAYATLPIAHFFKDDDNTLVKNEKLRSLFQQLRQQDWISKMISGIAKVGLSAYAVEVFCLAIRACGFHFPALWDVPAVYSKAAYSIWALRRFLEVKTLFLCRICNVQADNMGRVEVLDRVLSGVSVALVGLLLMDWLSLQMGHTIKGLAAFASVGTLAFTFASQDLVSQLMSGISLSLSGNYFAGDDVQFGNVVDGKIVKQGWMETVLREADNTITSVPNSKLAKEKISNFSRVQISQVKQTLRFYYENADEIPALLETIREEIKASCPELITDGSRPFRVFWTSFNEDHLEVMVNAHFNIPPKGDAYWINRQNVLMAVNRAVKKHNLEFAKLYRFEAPGQVTAWRAVGPKPSSALNENGIVDGTLPNGGTTAESEESVVGEEDAYLSVEKERTSN